MMRKTKTTATYFNFLKVRNVRCFGEGSSEEHSLRLTDEDGKLNQWTLILGDNGVGKTTLLQCLVWMRPVLIDFDEGKAADPLAPTTKGTLGCALQDEENELLERLLRINGTNKLRMIAEVSQGENISFGSSSRYKIKTEIAADFDEKRLLEKFEQSEINIKKIPAKKFWEPFIVAYGANRQIGYQNADSSALDDPLAKRLSEVTELYDAEERLTELNHAATDKKYKRSRRQEKRSGKNGAARNEPVRESKEEKLLETFKQAVIEILPNEITSDERIEIEAPKLVDGELKKSVVKLRINNIAVPLSDLSLGYKTTLAWTLDLAWRLFNRYPKSPNPLSEPAVVLIDEIDLHLHPRWQREIMAKLANVFKRTQFIATAHSPLMVQSMPDANFAIVRKIDDDFLIENEPQKIKGWRVDQILNSEYFNVTESRPPEYEKLFEERSRLLLKIKRTSMEERRLKELQEQISELPTGPVPPHESDAAHLLRRATELLEKNK